MVAARAGMVVGHGGHRVRVGCHRVASAGAGMRNVVRTRACSTRWSNTPMRRAKRSPPCRNCCVARRAGSIRRRTSWSVMTGSRFLDQGLKQPVFAAAPGAALRDGAYRRDISPLEVVALHPSRVRGSSTGWRGDRARLLVVDRWLCMAMAAARAAAAVACAHAVAPCTQHGRRIEGAVWRTARRDRRCDRWPACRWRPRAGMDRVGLAVRRGRAPAGARCGDAPAAGRARPDARRRPVRKHERRGHGARRTDASTA